MQHLCLHLLGAFQVTLDGEPVNGFRTQKTRALLAYLAVEARPHERDHLAGLLWPEWPDAVARTYLRQALTNLRRLLDGDPDSPPLLLSDNHTVQINPAASLWLDTAALTEALSDRTACVANDDRPDLIARLEEAAALYRGEFLQGFCIEKCEAYQEWQLQTAHHMQRHMLDALGCLSDWHERHGDYARAQQYARRQVELEPWIEESHRRLMRLLAFRGEPAAALAHYDQYRGRLATELNAEPDTETQALCESIRLRQLTTVNERGYVSEKGAHVPGTCEVPGTSQVPPPNNLSAPLTPLVGRMREREAIQALLRRPEVRLATLVGPGGVGKTRLGQQIAADLLGDFPDGVYFVSLAPTREPGLIPSAIAQALDVREAPHQPIMQTLMFTLRARTLLLVLDNFEHVAPAAPIVTELLRACPHLKVLATSREALHLNGEHEFVVPPLACPRLYDADDVAALSEFTAVELFRQRAAATRHDFVLDRVSGPVVAELCSRLDGLPLAIELAAARIKHLSPQAMLQRWGRESLDRDEPSPTLQLLQSHTRDIPQRHRSLRDAIAWSYELLDAEEQALFQRLAIFVGGWTREAAAAICGEGLSLDMLDGLTSLMDKHLVQAAEDGDPTSRFMMLETLREYGLEQLQRADELPAVQQRMAAYYVRLAEAVRSRQFGPDFSEATKLLRLEHANLRAVFRWAHARREVELCLRLCAALHVLWTSFPREGEQTALAALEIADDSPSSLPHALTLACAGYFCHLLSHTEAAYRLLARSLAMREAIGRVVDPLYPSVALGILAWIEFWRGNYDRAEAYHEEQLAHERNAGHDWALAMTLGNMGDMSLALGKYDEAQQRIDESLLLHRRVGQVWGIAKALSDQGALYIRCGQLKKAGEMLTESLALCEGAQALNLLSGVKRHLGRLALQVGDTEQAASALNEALTRCTDLGDQHQIVVVFELIARLALRLEEPQRGLTLMSAAAALRASLGQVIPPIDREPVAETIRIAREQLGQEEADVAWAAGEAMSLDDAINYALKTTQL